MPDAAALAAMIRPLRLLLLDVDGVLTDGGLWYGPGGVEMKRFDIHDGMGIDLLRRAGLAVGVLTGRVSEAVERRARELGMEVVKQGYYDKTAALEEVLAERGLTAREVGYVGDDLLDLAVMRRVGFRAAPANAVPEVRAEADYVATRRGGAGAVREIAEAILDALGARARVVGEATRRGTKAPAGHAAAPRVGPKT